jgi:hypothetical protein
MLKLDEVFFFDGARFFLFYSDGYSEVLKDLASTSGNVMMEIESVDDARTRLCLQNDM